MRWMMPTHAFQQSVANRLDALPMVRGLIAE
jgi:hypothetical protein